jgi:general secretion pathway protein A
MYESYYGFSIKPFQIVPNPDFLYLNSRYENALTYLEYGIMEKVGFVLLTGEVGSGKTTIIKHLLRQIESQFEIAVVFNTNVSPGELINMVNSEFEIERPEGDKSSSLDVLHQYLIDCYAKDRRVLLIIDEAQNLSRDALEEVRMLSNLQTDDQLLLQIILVGQPEIRDRLKSKDMVQLNQRISVAHHLPALTREEADEYIAYRLEKAGGRRDLFTTKAVDLIYQASGGIPRTINILCDSALVYGFADELKIIDALLVEQVIHDRDGMGLGIVKKEEEAPSADSPTDFSALAGLTDGFAMTRLGALEQKVEKLQAMVEKQIAALEKKADESKEDLAQKMKDLYTQEKKKTEKLIFVYAKLKEQFQALLAEKEKTEMPEGQTDEIAFLRESATLLQRENRKLKETYNELYDTYQDMIDGNAQSEKSAQAKQGKKSS